MPRNYTFTPDALSQFQVWLREDSKMAEKILDFIGECAREPFKGRGKPEPLKGDLKGYWSRRLNQEHRLIYRVDNETVFILSCHGHYQ